MERWLLSSTLSDGLRVFVCEGASAGLRLGKTIDCSPARKWKINNARVSSSCLCSSLFYFLLIPFVFVYFSPGAGILPLSTHTQFLSSVILTSVKYYFAYWTVIWSENMLLDLLSLEGI